MIKIHADGSRDLEGWPPITLPAPRMNCVMRIFALRMKVRLSGLAETPQPLSMSQDVRDMVLKFMNLELRFDLERQ